MSTLCLSLNVAFKNWTEKCYILKWFNALQKKTKNMCPFTIYSTIHDALLFGLVQTNTSPGFPVIMDGFDWCLWSEMALPKRPCGGNSEGPRLLVCSGFRGAMGAYGGLEGADWSSGVQPGAWWYYGWQMVSLRANG